MVLKYLAIPVAALLILSCPKGTEPPNATAPGAFAIEGLQDVHLDPAQAESRDTFHLVQVSGTS